MEILRRHGTLEQTREEAHPPRGDARAALADVPSHDLTDMMAIWPITWSRLT
jgi:hypothetical protein